MFYIEERKHTLKRTTHRFTFELPRLQSLKSSSVRCSGLRSLFKPFLGVVENPDTLIMLPQAVHAQLTVIICYAMPEEKEETNKEEGEKYLLQSCK